MRENEWRLPCHYPQVMRGCVVSYRKTLQYKRRVGGPSGKGSLTSLWRCCYWCSGQVLGHCRPYTEFSETRKVLVSRLEIRQGLPGVFLVSIS